MNNVFMAILAVAVFVFSAMLLSEGIYHADVPEQPGYAIAGADPAVGDNPAPAEEEIEGVAAMLAKMEVSEGEKVARKCVACHNFEKGAQNKVGPALYGIVNAPIAAVEGFKYSAALTEFGQGKVWDYDTLNKFLYKPKGLVRKTTMGFAGLKKVGDRAAMIAYLRAQADEPAPMPTAEEAAAAEDTEAQPAASE